jgi:phosphoglycolate phosphatase-like HAD superfamily hydrolase
VLLLFDIDGTLLQRAADAHARALRVALHAVYGVGSAQGAPTDLPRVQAAGRTDMEIARETLLLCGRSAAAFEDGRDELAEVCVREYALLDGDLSSHVVAGMAELLHELASAGKVRLSLVTGNLEGIARLKLRRAGIGVYFQAGQGGFGSDSEDRTDLPPIARARAGVGGEPYPRERTLVIGDTPRDIACAHADGLGCVAVTTGPYAAAQLIGADAVVNTTQELRELLAARVGEHSP